MSLVCIRAAAAVAAVAAFHKWSCVVIVWHKKCVEMRPTFNRSTLDQLPNMRSGRRWRILLRGPERTDGGRGLLFLGLSQIKYHYRRPYTQWGLVTDRKSVDYNSMNYIIYSLFATQAIIIYYICTQQVVYIDNKADLNTCNYVFTSRLKRALSLSVSFSLLILSFPFSISLSLANFTHTSFSYNNVSWQLQLTSKHHLQAYSSN